MIQTTNPPKLQPIKLIWPKEPKPSLKH